MRLTPCVFSLLLVAVPGNLEAARPIRRAKPAKSAAPAVSSVHQVRPGETATRIARESGLTLGQLVELNPTVRLSQLSAGMMLVVSTRRQAVAPVAPSVVRPGVKAPGAVLVQSPTPIPVLGPGVTKIEAVRDAPVGAVAPLPVIPISGPATLVHLERLIPDSTKPLSSPLRSPVSMSTLGPFTSGNLSPVLPYNAGLE